MAKVRTTISPRRKRSFLLASALSEAEALAIGYSPPTPYPKMNCAHHTPATQFSALSFRCLLPPAASSSMPCDLLNACACSKFNAGP